jgi:hypothetical protein
MATTDPHGHTASTTSSRPVSPDLAKSPDVHSGATPAEKDPSHPKGKKQHPGRVRSRAAPHFQGRVPGVVDADAYPAVARFLSEHAADYARVGFGAAQVAVGSAAHEALAAALARETHARGNRAPLLPPDAGPRVERAHRLVSLARDSLYRVSGAASDLPARRQTKRREGDERRSGFAMRRRFGFDHKLVRHSPEALRAAITAFLAGAKEDPESLARAFVGADHLAALEAARADLDALVAAKGSTRLGREAATAEGAQAHEALERFYDQFAAATNMAYVDDEGTRVLALRLVPRARDLHRARRKEMMAATPVPDALPAEVGAPAVPPPVPPRG